MLPTTFQFGPQPCQFTQAPVHRKHGRTTYLSQKLDRIGLSRGITHQREATVRKKEKPHPKSSVVGPLWCRLCPSIANTTSSRESDKTTRRRVTTATASPTHPALIPLLLCSLIWWPHGTHPPLPAKPPLIIDLRKIHIQYARKDTHTHTCPHAVYIKLFIL